MLSGFVICAIAALTLCAAYLVCYGITIAIGYFKAMNRSTYLPLTKEEIEANGLTSMKEYVAYVYNQIVYFAGTYDNRSIYNIYTSNNLHKDLESAMIAYFGENEKDSIKYILHNLFYGNSFSDAKFTDDIWENLNPADYIIEAFQKRNSKKKK